MMDEIYNPAKGVRNPKSLGVNPSGDALIKNMDSLKTYAGYITTGPGLGDRYLLNVGQCNDESVEECRLKTKQIVVDNVPEGVLKIRTPFGKTEFKGLIPSIGEDMWRLADPSAWGKRTSLKCIKRTADVGDTEAGFKPIEFCGPDMGGGLKNDNSQDEIQSLYQGVLMFTLFLLLVIAFFSRYVLV